MILFHSLSPEEEKYYLLLLSQGDEDARQILIERNLRLVAHVVKKFENIGEDKEDLISIIHRINWLSIL